MANLFIDADTYTSTETAKLTRIDDSSKTNGQNPNFFWLFLLAIVFALGFIGYIYNIEQQTDTEQFDTQQNIKEQRLKQLTDKIAEEELTDSEWEELCELLAEVKGIYVNDCENCKNYVKALLQLKHYKHLKNYEQRPDKKLKKGIKKYQRRIREHYDKINNPQNSISEWDNLHPNQKEDLVNNHWPNDIKRLNEQKEILECILKNR